jgi:hypothetical protein
MPIKKKTVLLASILAAAAMTLAVGSAEARHGGWSSGGHWGGGHWGHMRSHAFVGRSHFAFSHRPHFRHHHHRFLAVAPYYYDYGYGDGCYWLKRRALYTGSGYWWNRYYNCINGYGYY